MNKEVKIEHLIKEKLKRLAATVPFSNFSWGYPSDYEYITLKDISLLRFQCSYV